MNFLGVLIVVSSLYVGFNSGLRGALTILLHLTAASAMLTIGSVTISPNWLEAAISLMAFATVITLGGLLQWIWTVLRKSR